MRTAVQLDEESIVRSIVDGLELPSGVKFKRVEQSADWEGTPALRIYFNISKSVKLTPKRVTSLSELTRKVQRLILDSGIEKWPYIHFLDVK